MRIAPFPLALLALAAGAVAMPMPGWAQSDPAAARLIEQLRPRAGGATRGIRLPSAPAPGAAAEAAPGAAPAVPAPPPVATTQRPAPRPPVVPDTTAPEGVAAVSITVTFPSGSATLTPQAEARLAPLGRALSSADLAPFRFLIEGHTDSVGDEAMNLDLSERRAAAVRDYLIRQFGVSGSRLQAVGLGETRLLVPTGDGVNEPRNRRVQVINLDG
ncbi:OmpA family protein [Roseomonas frigidaquae]|uniref:OmpA family protein n=1 Tax=Falsiroseomonas frigidaquae TaxID=487318 RepID=A0ABX1F3K5_9PROT|nr:OmpA family protein [Falsiroseomonas frigidaquae]NKE46941.1 OmpA family protein [Falsiroseomonas frigidaquae]